MHTLLQFVYFTCGYSLYFSAVPDRAGDLHPPWRLWEVARLPHDHHWLLGCCRRQAQNSSKTDIEKQYHCSMLMESVGFQGFTIYPTQTHSSNVFCVKTIIFSVRMRSCWYSWLNPMACHWYLMRETARGLHFTRHSKGGPAVSANHSYSSIFRAYIVELFVCECRPS